MKTFKFLLKYLFQSKFLIIIASVILFLQCQSMLIAQTIVTDFPIEPPASTEIIYESRERHDLFDEFSPKGLRVVQITTHPYNWSSHVYTEAQIFTPDSRRFVFQRGTTYWLCDIEDNYGIRMIINEEGARGPSISPDGKWVYYVTEEMPDADTHIEKFKTDGVIQLKRVSLENFTRETILTHKGPLPGTNYPATRLYPLTSISSDGKRLCVSVFLGDGRTEFAGWGAIVFDLVNPSLKLVFAGKYYCNMHLQYCSSLEPELSHDIMIQHNHECIYDKYGNIFDSSGKLYKLVGGDGADLHVIRDDGTFWRDVPLGRDGVFRCQGHQQWFGRSGIVISNMSGAGRRPIYIGWPIETGSNDSPGSHKGFNIPGGRYVDITRNLDYTDFVHLSPDISGTRIVTDASRFDKKTNKRIVRLVIGTLSSSDNPILKVQYLLDTKTSFKGQVAHPHPFFSPDTRMAFFNTDREGIPQVFMVTEYKFPEF